MKRSYVNDVLREGDAFIRSFSQLLPPFAYWSPEDMRSDAAAPIRERGLGWDITDYGQGKFDDLGRGSKQGGHLFRQYQQPFA